MAGLLLGEHIPPDLLVELLLPMLWLEHAVGHPRNLCVTCCVTLRYAYEALGIVAHPRAVDLSIVDQRTGQPTSYGRPDPYWSGTTFHGHCVLWLPATMRVIDPTVEQYPELRRYELGPICGKIASSLATPEQAERLRLGELVPGAAVGVQRGDLMLLYTTVEHDYDDVVMSGAPVRDNDAEARRSGHNLAAQAIALLRNPQTLPRARRAPHARVRELLNLLADAETTDSDDGIRFILPGDPTRTARRLDELPTTPDPGPRPRRTARAERAGADDDERPSTPRTGAPWSWLPDSLRRLFGRRD